jgi:hypothetical protein
MILAGCALLVLQSSAVQAQWTTANGNNNISNTNTGGNVGIGVTDAATPLEINRNQNGVVKLLGLNNPSNGASAQAALSFFEGGTEKAKFGVNSSGATGYVGGANAFQMWNLSNAPIVFGTNGTERLRIVAGGNIGIGTTSPGTPLTVAADGNAMSFRAWRNGNSAGWGVVGLRMALNNSSGAVADYAGINGVIVTNTAGAEDGALSFWTTKSGTITEQARIDKNGQLGIGTTSPNKSSVSRALTINGSSDAIYELAVGDVRKGTMYHDSTNMSFTNNANGALTLGTNNTERFRIDASGNVGIGMTNVLYSLDVNGGGNGFRVKANSVASNDTIATFEGAGGIQAIVRANGNVGLGITSPTEKLDVVGNLKVSGAGAGNITASGTITGGTITAKYQDVAEWVESSQALAAGTVVVLDHTRSNQVVASSKSYDTRVAGVISAQPGITLGEKSDSKVLVATTGRVKVKVDATAGPIEVGDLLVTSEIQGVAKKSEPLNLGGVQIHRPGTLIGKALEPLEKGTGEILVLLSLQ